jgi:uncharacterized protein YbjT (DUF2867 family)
MILITGAGGKTGQAVMRALAGRAAAVRAWVRCEEQAELARQLGASQVVWGDMADEAVLEQAMVGVRAVYLICPNMYPDELAIGERVIAAAQHHSIQHLVYHSVLHPQTQAMPHHWQKNQMEEKLFASGIPYTILQPTAYMQNILAGWQRIIGQGIFANPYPVNTRLSLVNLHDVAEVVARVLTEPGHLYATYELVGTRPHTQTEVANILSQQVGHPVQAQATSLAEWQATTSNLSPYALDTLLKMFHYYGRYGLEGNPTVLTLLLSRPPTSLEEFIHRFQGKLSASQPVS